MPTPPSTPPLHRRLQPGDLRLAARRLQREAEHCRANATTSRRPGWWLAEADALERVAAALNEIPEDDRWWRGAATPPDACETCGAPNPGPDHRYQQGCSDTPQAGPQPSFAGTLREALRPPGLRMTTATIADAERALNDCGDTNPLRATAAAYLTDQYASLLLADWRTMHHALQTTQATSDHLATVLATLLNPEAT